jgi:hypothetical protein
MNTPEKQANYLIEKFLKIGCRSFEDAEFHSAKQSALICVDEILLVIQDLPIENIEWSFWNDVYTIIKQKQQL